MTHKEEDTKEYLLDVLDEYFNRGVDKKKFIDVNRIPLICQDISNIHADIRGIKSNLSWAIKGIMGGIGAVIIALILNFITKL